MRLALLALLILLILLLAGCATSHTGPAKVEINLHFGLGGGPSAWGHDLLRIHER